MNGVKGRVDILNKKAGDVTIEFGGDDPQKLENARKAITDMLRRGYFITVRVGDEDRKVTEFDPATDTYTIMGVPDEQSKVNAKEHTATAIAPSAGG